MPKADRRFLYQTLAIPDNVNINIVDAHRLPQQPLKDNARKTRQQKLKKRPIIFKVSSVFENDKIWGHLSSLKDHNSINESDPLFVTDYLPKDLAVQKNIV